MLVGDGRSRGNVLNPQKRVFVSADVAVLCGGSIKAASTMVVGDECISVDETSGNDLAVRKPRTMH